jgi:hypothetical protein
MQKSQRITMVLPEVNRGKAKIDTRRHYAISVDGVLIHKVYLTDGLECTLDLLEGSEVVVTRSFNGYNDSTFTYTIGAFAAKLEANSRVVRGVVTYPADFTDGVLFVQDDSDFSHAKLIAI